MGPDLIGADDVEEKKLMLLSDAADFQQIAVITGGLGRVFEVI